MGCWPAMMRGEGSPWLPLLSAHVFTAARRCALTAGTFATQPPVDNELCCLPRRQAACCRLVVHAIGGFRVCCPARRPLICPLSAVQSSQRCHGRAQQATKRPHPSPGGTPKALRRQCSCQWVSCTQNRHSSTPAISRTHPSLSRAHAGTLRAVACRRAAFLPIRAPTAAPKRSRDNGAAFSGSARQARQRCQRLGAQRYRRRQGANRIARRLIFRCLRDLEDGCLHQPGMFASTTPAPLQVVVSDDNLADIQAEYDGPGGLRQSCAVL